MSQSTSLQELLLADEARYQARRNDVESSKRRVRDAFLALDKEILHALSEKVYELHQEQDRLRGEQLVLMKSIRVIGEQASRWKSGYEVLSRELQDLGPIDTWLTEVGKDLEAISTTLQHIHMGLVAKNSPSSTEATS